VPADTGLSDWPKGPKPWDSHTKQSKRVNDSRARSTLVSAVGSQHYYPQADARCCAANNTFRGLRSFVGTQDLAFVQYTTSEDWMYERPYHEELYDMTSDHYQCVPCTFRPDLSAWPVLGPELLAVRCSSRVADDCLRAGCRISAARLMLRWCRSCRRGWRRSGTAPGRAADCL